MTTRSIQALLLVALAASPTRGDGVWFADGPSQKFVSTPAVGHGLVFSFGGSPEKRAMAIRLAGSGDVSNSHVVWRNERAMPYVPSPLLAGDYLHETVDPRETVPADRQFPPDRCSRMRFNCAATFGCWGLSRRAVSSGPIACSKCPWSAYMRPRL